MCFYAVRSYHQLINRDNIYIDKVYHIKCALREIWLVYSIKVCEVHMFVQN